MKLLDEIIDSLSSESSSLTDALLKTKVLLHKIGHQELTQWVNHELNGYPDASVVPSYRVLPAQVLANAASIAYQFSGHPIPLGHLTSEQRQSLQTAKMGQSLAELEKLTRAKKGTLVNRIPMEWNGLLGKGLAKGVQIQQAWSEISAASISGIFVQVRSRLLHFLLPLQEKLKGTKDEEEIRKKSNAINAAEMFKDAIFGDNVTIVVGTDNTVVSWAKC